MAKYQTADEWLKTQSGASGGSGGQYQTAEEWLSKNARSINETHFAVKREANQLREEWASRRNATNQGGAIGQEQRPAQQESRAGVHARRKQNAILQEMMDDDAARARDEYEAAYRQYQQAEQNYYTVPDGDFQKVEDDFLAADERLRTAQRRMNQANQASKDTAKAIQTGTKGYSGSNDAVKSGGNAGGKQNPYPAKLAPYSKATRTSAEILEEKAGVDQEVDELRKQLRTLQQQQAGYSRSFTIGNEERERVKTQIEEVQAALKEAESRQGELELSANLAQRREKITAYDQYREEADFSSVAEEAKNAGGNWKSDPLGYYHSIHGYGDSYITMGGQSSDPNNWRMLQDDEEQMYYYLLGSQGTKAAKQYLNDLQIELDRRSTAAAQKRTAELYQSSNDAGKFAWNALTVPANVFGSISAPLGDAVSVLSGKGYNPYNSGHNLTDFASTIRGEGAADIEYAFLDDETKALQNELAALTQEEIKLVFSGSASMDEFNDVKQKIEEVSAALEAKEGENSKKIPWGKIASNTYQAVMSGADSALGATLFGNGYTTIMGAGAASQRARELWEAGVPDAQIGMGAIASGLIEMATEKYSIEYFTGHFLEGDITGFKDWATKTLIQGLNEGSEEVASELANMVADALILGANSDNQREIRELMESGGLSYDEAEKQAYMNRVIDVLWAGYGGAVSGGTMGGFGGALNKAVQINRDTVQALGAEQAASETNAKAAAQGQSKQEGNGFTVQANAERGTTEISFPEKPPQAVQEALKENGFRWSKTDKVWYGQRSEEEARRIVLDAGGELFGKSGQSGQSEEAAPAGQEENQTEITADHTILSAPEEDSGQVDTNEKPGAISKPFRASDNGATLLNLPDGSTVETEITGIASNEPGKLMLNVAGQDSPVSAGDISYADAGEASVYYFIDKMKLMPAAADMIVEQAKNFVQGTDGLSRAEKMADFASNLFGMYSLGESGIPAAKAMSSLYAGGLNETMAEAGYQLGRRIYDQNVQAKEAQKQALAASQRARAATGGQKVNGVRYDGLNVRQGRDGTVEIDGVALNEQQKTGIQAAELLGSMGVNIHIFQSRLGADGKPVGENGSYHMADGSIHIDLNAGADGQGVMAYTISHELTHFMEDQQPAQFQKFSDALFEDLDTEVEAEIARKAEALKRQLPEQYKDAGNDKLMEDARSEVVAEACETMLTDTDAARQIAQRIQAQDASLWEKIVQWFKDFEQKLRSAYNGLKPGSGIAKDAKKTLQQVDGLVKMWADMAVDSAENYREAANEKEAENAVDDNGVKYQARRLNSDDISEYLMAGDRENRKKISALNEGKKLILTSENEITEYIDNAIDRNLKSNHTVAYGKVNDRLAQDVFGLSNGKIKISNHFLELIPDNLQHAYEQHSTAKQDGDIALDRTDFERIPEYLDSYTEIVYAIKYSSGKVGVCVSKKLPNGRILLIETVSKSRGALQFKNAIGVSEEKYKRDYVDVYKKRVGTNTGGSESSNNSPHDESNSKSSIRNSEPDVNQKISDQGDTESDFYDAGIKCSARVTDDDTLSFLNSQKTIKTYKTMQVIDGKLYPPMAARVDGKHEDYSELGAWEQATEHPELIKGNGKFKLDKGKGQGSLEAAYNPYMHSSNLVLNDQFSGAYTRDNLVTVECEVPESELTSGYHAQYAKDSVGWHAWHTGTVAGSIRKAKGIERQVFLSRWIKPVRIIPDAEVARMYKELLDGTDIAVPDNVVTPSLLSELKKVGVKIEESGRVKYSNRYSQRRQDQQVALEKQNEKLREDVSNLKELLRLQGTVTGGKVFKPESLRTAANFIIKETGRSLEDFQKTEFEDILRKAYEALSNESVTYDDIARECTNVAQWLDENGETRDALDDYAGRILSEMRGVPIRLDETQKQEARRLFGSLTEFRSRIAGTYRLSNDGVPLDDIWNGLAIEHPMYFDNDASSTGLPGLLVESIDRLRNTKDVDPYQHMPVELMMAKVYDGFWKAKKLTTVADRYQAKIDSLNQKHNKAMQEIRDEHRAEIQGLNQAWDEEATALKQLFGAELEYAKKEYTEKRKASVENRHRTQYRQAIHKMADQFHKMATAPAKSNTAHAPVYLVNSIARFCDIFADSEERAVQLAYLDLQAKEKEMLLLNETRGQTKGRAKEAEVIQRQRNRAVKRQAAVSAMRQQYAAIQKDSALSMFYDEHVDGLLNQLSDLMSEKDIYEMDTNQLKQVYKTMKAMMYTITNANKAFSMGKDKTLIGIVKKMAGEMDSSKVSHGVFATWARDNLIWQMSPDNFFSYLCGFKKGNEGEAIQKAFSQGTEKMLGVQRDFYQMFRHLTEAQDKETKKHIRDMMAHPLKEMIDFGMKDANGKAVSLPRDMMLQVYMLLNQKDSFDSLVYGGFTLPNVKDYYGGKIDKAYGGAEESAMQSLSIGQDYNEIVNQIKALQAQIDVGGLDVKDVNRINKEIDGLRNQAKELVKGSEARLIELRNSIEKKLTAADRDAIETAKKWYKYTGQLMTDVYLQMYGYKPNLVDGYVPIHRDLSSVKTDIREGEEAKAFNLENSGFTKDRVKSVAPILLTGFFQELGSQQQRISKYYGFAQVQKDFNRIWKMRVPGSMSTINKKVAAKYGTGKRGLGISGEQYILNYIQSVAGVQGKDDILSKFYRNAASATLSFNLRVALSQAASVPTASAVVGWKSMAVGFAKGIRTSFSAGKKAMLANDSVWFYNRYRGAGGITELADLKAKGGIWAKVASSSLGNFLFNWCQHFDVFATASMWAMAEDYVQGNGMKTTDDGYHAAVEQCYADIIRKSQPNYTVTERSDLLRDKRGGMKLLTMYKTQSNQNLNILISAIGEYRAAKNALNASKNATTIADMKAANAKLANGVTSVTLGGTLCFVMLRALANLIMAKVNPWRDKETGEITGEAVAKALLDEAFSSVFGMYALGGQLYDIVSSVVTGDYYFGISDSAVSLLYNASNDMVSLGQKIADHDKDVEWKDIEKAMTSVLTACGVPAKNLKGFYTSAEQWYRDIKGGTFGQFVSDDITKKQYDARFYNAWRDGNTEKANNALTMLAEMSDEDEDELVQKEVSQYFANEFLEKKVLAGEVSLEDAKKLLKDIGHNDPDGKCAKWGWRMEIPAEIYEQASKYKSKHKKDKVMEYIDTLDLTKDQKDSMYLAFGYAESGLSDTPWH